MHARGKADLTHTGSWLESSNIKNTEFYESHGFVGVVDVVIGNHNPTWHEPPVIVKVVRNFLVCHKT